MEVKALNLISLSSALPLKISQRFFLLTVMLSVTESQCQKFPKTLLKYLCKMYTVMLHQDGSLEFEVQSTINACK